MRYRQLRKSGMALGLILLPTLAGCASQTQIPATNSASFCQILTKPITYSRLKDTEETIIEIREINAVWAKLCAGS